MKFSREAYYGLIALTYLADRRHGTILQAGQLAEGADLPRVFLAKILHRLGRHGILRSHRGKERGYSLARAPKSITARETIEAIDGAEVFSRCIFWSNACSDRAPCPLHDMWTSIRPKLGALLERTTLEQLAAGRHPSGLRTVLGTRTSWPRRARTAAG